VRALLWGRVWEVYIKVPPKAGGRYGNLTEKQLNRLKPVEPDSTRGFSVHRRTQPETGPDSNLVEPDQNSVEPDSNSVEPVSNSVEPDSKFS
jgi:hypothetical protein